MAEVNGRLETLSWSAIRILAGGSAGTAGQPGGYPQAGQVQQDYPIQEPVALDQERLQKLGEFVQRWKLNEDAQHKLLKSSPEVQDLVMSSFDPPSDLDEVSGKLIALAASIEKDQTKSLRMDVQGKGSGHGCNPMAGVQPAGALTQNAGVASPSLDELVIFCQKWNLNEVSQGKLLNLQPIVQRCVIEGFAPPPGVPELNGKFMAFASSVEKQLAIATGHMPQGASGNISAPGAASSITMPSVAPAVFGNINMPTAAPALLGNITMPGIAPPAFGGCDPLATSHVPKGNGKGGITMLSVPPLAFGGCDPISNPLPALTDFSAQLGVTGPAVAALLSQPVVAPSVVAPPVMAPTAVAPQMVAPPVLTPVAPQMTAPAMASPLAAPLVTAQSMTAAPVSAPAVSAPPVAAPPVTAPPVAAPVTAPPVSAPPVTAPPATAPVTATPAAAPVTAPPVSAPPVAAPPGTAPSVVAPPSVPQQHGVADNANHTGTPAAQGQVAPSTTMNQVSAPDPQEQQACATITILEEEFAAFQQHWSLNDDAMRKLRNLPAEAQYKVMSEFVPPPGTRDANDSFIFYVTNMERAIYDGNSRGMPSVYQDGRSNAQVESGSMPVIKREDLIGFVQRWSLNEDAQYKLMKLNPECQLTVMNKFNPLPSNSPEGTDVNGKFILFAVSIEKGYNENRLHCEARGIGENLQNPYVDDRLFNFCRQWGLNQDAQRKLMKLAPELQNIVMNNFAPNHGSTEAMTEREVSGKFIMFANSVEKRRTQQDSSSNKGCGKGMGPVAAMPPNGFQQQRVEPY